MAFNGSGVFVRIYNWVNDAAASIKIRADRMDNEMNGFATGLSTCITKDGQTTVTANLPMSNFRHTGVGDAAARTQYASFGQMQDGKAAWVAAGGTVDAITANYSIPVTALVDGQLCSFRASGDNLTTTPTFSPNGLTARTITKEGGAALAESDFTTDAEVMLRYNLANTRWEWVNQKTTLTSEFSDSAFRIQDNGDTTKEFALEVSGVSTGTTRTMTVPNYDFTPLTLSGTETATNKSFVDASTAFVDDSDATKKLAFQCSGITTGTTRTITAPDASGTMLLAYTPITASLGADVALNNTSNYFDGPSIAQGTTGTWFVSGTVTLFAVVGAGGVANHWDVKLWDGTTVIASAGYLNAADASNFTVTLSGYLASPAGDLRISVKNETSTAAKILYNYSGNSKDSTISAFRIA